MMSTEVKQRKKVSTSKEGKDGQPMAPPTAPQIRDEVPGKTVVDPAFKQQRPPIVEVRTVLCLLCLAICGALSWFVFEQSRTFSILEHRYQSLQTRSEALEELGDKIRLVFGKLESTEDILAEAKVSSSVVTNLQQHLSNLQDNLGEVQNNEHLLSTKMQHVNMRFQTITDTWKKSLDEMNLHTSSLKSDIKEFHSHATRKINAADNKLNLVSERLKDMEDSTKRNMRTVKSHEEEEFVKIKEQINWDTKAIEELEKQQSNLVDTNEEVKQNMVELKPKLGECIQNLPTIENAIHTLLKTSNEMLEMDKKMNELSVQVFNTEDNLLKVISEILEIQHGLEQIQFDNSILKMQNDISVLKEDTQRLLSEKQTTSLSMEEEEPSDKDQI
uniref:IKBKB interacting protein n=1 Tax=Leptobrachium leishanense TaxID=445787 RepID=A0A8C5QQQ1_9ANUR